MGVVFALHNVPKNSLIMDFFVSSQVPMEEESGMLFGKKKSVREKIPRDVNKMELCGIPNAELDSTQSVAAYVLLTVLKDGPILVFLVKNQAAMEEE